MEVAAPVLRMISIRPKTRGRGEVEVNWSGAATGRYLAYTHCLGQPIATDLTSMHMTLSAFRMLVRLI